MPTGPRPASRPGAGPGRGKPRARSTPRKPAAAPREPLESRFATEQSSESLAATPEGPRASLTTRAIALAVVFLILTISYASSLRIYFAQSAQIAETKQQIRDSQTRIADLQSSLARWDDPEYVKTQARVRLGWVMPGETGFTVVGQDGQPLGGGAEITSAQPAVVPPDAWWNKLWGSVAAADQPAPTPSSSSRPARQPTITKDSVPGSSSASPSPLDPTPGPR
jgi:cell division protein FtsB